MNQTVFVLICSFLLYSCTNRIKESEDYVFSQKDIILLDSYNFIKQNMSDYDFGKLFIEGDTAPLFIKDLEFTVQQYKDRIKTDIIPFDVFCNYILPPVVFNEKYDDWRIECNNQYSDLINDYADIKFICDTLNRDLAKGFKFSYTNTGTSKNWKQFNTQKEGDCYLMSQAILYPLRALGYPTAIDYTLGWGNTNGAHSWNSIYYDDKWYPFMGLEATTDYKPFLIHDNTEDNTKNGYRYPAKIFRKTFSVNPLYLKITQLLPEAKKLSLFNDIRFKDVTNEYFDVKKISIKNHQDLTNQVLFLAIYNNNRWLLTDAALLNTDTFTFENLNTNMLYLPYLYPDNIAFSDPFILQDDGSMRYLSPDNQHRENISIEFLYPRILEYMQAWANINNAPNDIFKGIANNYYRERPQKGLSYTLYYYSKDWIKVRTNTLENNTLTFENVPSNALLKIQDQEGKDIGRCFTFDNQRCIWW